MNFESASSLMNIIQSTGQISIQTWHRVHDQVSMTYSLPFLKIEFSGQSTRQLSQEIQRLLISSFGIIITIIR
jgi:hypothetical protein